MTSNGPRARLRGGKAARSETSGGRIYVGSVRAFSLVFIALGLAIVATTLANGGGPLAVGMLMGSAFVAVGAVRLWLSLRAGR
jgi:hypothetical protein